MSSFMVNRSNTRYEVFKDGEQLFSSKFIQVVLHSGLIIFVRDLLSESVVLTPGTSIKLPHGVTKIGIVADATTTTYEIEAQHGLAARALFNEILTAAGQKESKVTDDASVAVASAIIPPIQQLSNLLVNCMEEMARNVHRSSGGGGEGSRDHGPLPPNSGNLDLTLGGGYHSTYNNGTYSVRFGSNQEQMDFQEFQVDDTQGPGPSPPDYYDVGHHDESGGNFQRKRHFDFDEGPGFVSRKPLKRSKFHDEYARQLFVGNLPQTTTESELADVFSAFGEIEKIHIIKNDSPSTPYIAFVLYDFETSAQRAVKNKANIHLKMRDGSERRLNIQGVKPKPWRPPKAP